MRFAALPFVLLLAALPARAFHPAVPTSALVGYIPVPSSANVKSLSFSPDSRLLASGGWDGTVRIWDTASGEPVKVLLKHRDAVNAVAFSPRGSLLASGGRDGEILLWDTGTWKNTKALSEYSSVTHIAFGPTNDTIAVAGIRMSVWDVSEAKLLRAIDTYTLCLAASVDGRMLASNSGTDGMTLWNTETGDRLCTAKVGKEYLEDIAISPSGDVVACACRGDSVLLLSAVTGQRIRSLSVNGSAQSQVCFSPDGKLLATADYNGWIRTWSATTGNVLLAARENTEAVSSLAYSPDGKLIASGSEDGTIRLWNAATGKAIRTLKGHTSKLWK